MGIRISELPEKTTADAVDFVPIVDVAENGGYVTKKTTVAGLVLQAISSWWSGSSDKTKLDGIQSGATSNESDSYLLDRSHHTGSQAISTVDNLQDSLDSKAPVNSPSFTGTVSGVTKSMVGLSEVDNTSDANKPVSTATQTALNSKVSATTVSVSSGKTLSVSNSVTLTAADNATVDFGAGGTVLYPNSTIDGGHY